MKLKTLIKRTNDEALHKYYRKELCTRGYREEVKPTRITNDYFYVTTQWDIGYIDRENYSLDKTRNFFVKKDNEYRFLLYAEAIDEDFLTEYDIGHFQNLKSAINWVGRYGCTDSDAVQYYYVSKRYVIRIWNSTHLTEDACKILYGRIFETNCKESEHGNDTLQTK